MNLFTRPIAISSVLGALLGLMASCPTPVVATPSHPELNWTAYRVRAAVDVGLNAADGWAAKPNQSAALYYDEPFRVRVEIEGTSDGTILSELRLQARRAKGEWATVGLADFPYPRYATPTISLIAQAGYAMGEESEDLLGGSTLEHEDGIGLVGMATSPLFKLGPESMEWEWPLVIRHWADGPTMNDNGSTFEIRVIDAESRPLPGVGPITLMMTSRPGHLGGTFVETPARIGPYQSSSGALYFIMEPTETDNRLMMMTSTDHGLTWRELDGANRPSLGDLEGVGSVVQGGVIHIVHQISEAVYHHAFATDDVPGTPNQWLIGSRLITPHTEPETQVAAVNARPDGSLLAVYGNESGGRLQIGFPNGTWENQGIPLGTAGLSGLSGFQLATNAEGLSYVGYTAADGTGWLQILDPANVLSPPLLVSDTLGTEEHANGAFLPLLITPHGQAILIYRKADGSLWERRTIGPEALSPPRRVTSEQVVTGAVDSDQVGADAILHEGRIHVLYIDEATRSLRHTAAPLDGPWTTARLVAGDINAAWVRGSVLENAAGEIVYGFVYDAGSRGGAGMNRYGELPLN